MRFTAAAAPILAVLGLFASAAAAPEDAAPFPAGESTQQLEGLKCTVEMPAEFDPAKERSLIVILHGAGGSDDGMARSLGHLTKRDYVILAPKSKGQVWEAADLEAVKRIVASLKPKLRIGERRLHGVGFSNGGWNLAAVAFDEALRFQSATWVAAGCKGGKLPKHAKKEMGALALAGGNDANRDAAEATPGVLEDKVRTAEARIQPGLGHEWPDKLIPYFDWWVGVQEGKFVPGECAAFEWKATAKDAADAAAAAKCGSFVYWFAPGDAANEKTLEKAKTFQNDTLRDALVQRFGSQLPCAIASRDTDAEAWTALGAKATPAVAVYDATGKLKTLLQDKIDAKSLAAALRAVAPDKSLPK